MPRKYHRKLSLPTNSDEWMQRTWRPMMAMLYMTVCGFDFIIAPILWSILQAKSNGIITNQWLPLTLQGGGLFHLAMGAVLGISAYGRTQEKLSGVTTSGVTTAYQDNNIMPPVVNINQSTNAVPTSHDTTSL